MSIEKMSAKAKELKSKGHSAREISQEMHLSQLVHNVLRL